MKTKFYTTIMFLLITGFLLNLPMQASATTFESGGDRLIDLQQWDGGWDWPLLDADSTNTPKNTAAPIAMGLLAAYKQTGDSKYLAGAVKAGDFIKAVSPPHSTGNGIFMSQLSKVTGDSSYAADVKTEFYDALAAVTYDRNGTSYSTDSYAQYIYDLRESQHNSIGNTYKNLGIWDVGLAAAGAAALGVEQSQLDLWGDALENGLNFWEGTYSTGNSLFSVIGLAGGIYGLSELGQDLDAPISASNYLNGAQTVEELADILITYQSASGGFGMYADYPLDPYTGVQETAYAIISLASVDSELYAANIASAANWLMNVQLSTGGWAGGFAGSDPTRENNEITGEALWAVGAAVPEPATLVLFGLGLLGLAGISRRKNS